MTGIRPWLHHARVHAEWALRRPIASFGAGVVLACGPLSVGILGKLGPDLTIEFSEGHLTVGVVLLLATSVGILGVICRSLAGPDPRGIVGGHQALVLEALPLHPWARSWAEVAGSLAVWAPLLVAAVLLGGALPEADDATLVGTIGLVSEFARPHLLTGVLILIPGLVAGRRTTTMGEPGALGPLFLASVATLPVVAAVATSIPLALVVALASGFVVDRLVPASERLIDRLRNSVLLQLGTRSSAEPWHQRPSRLVWAAVRQALPVAILVAGGIAVFAAMWEDIDFEAAWVLAIFLLVLAPVFTPLALDGRTTSSRGRGGPLTGDFRLAWQLLPVEPVTIRRAALRQVAIGTAAGLLVGSAVVGWLGLGVLEVSARTAIELALGALAAAPLLTAVMLGDDRHRKVATAILALLLGTLYFGIIGVKAFDVSHGFVSVAVLSALPASSWLVWSMLRPCPDEVEGGLPYPLAHGQPREP